MEAADNEDIPLIEIIPAPIDENQLDIAQEQIVVVDVAEGNAPIFVNMARCSSEDVISAAIESFVLPPRSNR